MADSGASLTIPTQASALRKGGHVLMKGRPCKIVDMSTSKTGKHGHAKINMTGIDIFTGKKYEDLSPSTHNMDVPKVSRTEYQLIDISEEDFMTLMDDKGETREDIKLGDNEVAQEIRDKFENGDDFNVIIQAAMGEEAAVGVKNLVN
eukprot:TRINITY_DN7230_c0_g1_i2.p2 TRINITY_DN7230_c0_g1~~TRINITY_DN7230_c0_g1_i2.p2  ORF type:complete len:148 (+),score=47.93 TRINITY_DN7230_c0_g1_i2:71-514(+)